MIAAAEMEEECRMVPADEKDNAANHPVERDAFVCHSSLPGQSVPAQAGEEILQLLKSTAHDLRGAMVNVGAGLKLMEKGYYGQMDQRVSHEVRKLKSHVATLTGVLEDSLGRAFSLSEGVIQGYREVNLREDVLDPVLAELAIEMDRRGATLQNGMEPIPGEMLLLQGDCFWLKVIFRNLLRNALKYGGQGVKIAVGLRSRGDVFLVNIYNSGQAVPEELRPVLFDRVKPALTPRGGKNQGLGLGLWLIQQAVAKHGGEIRYQPWGDGSNFIFTLPRRPVAAHPAATTL
jgi:K+-sensing histidine kinase KdpD